MEENHYLPIAFKLGGHYEVEKILGEDDFEILYLVRDLHLGEQKFVLKELFLPSYCSRNEDASLYVMAKSKQLFEQTKKDIIDEVDLIKKDNDAPSPKLYGYFEENNTLYTIMEFVNDANVSPYLSVKENEANDTKDGVGAEVQVEAKVEDEDEKQTDNKSQNASIFLKILMLCLVIFLGLAFYGYTMLQADKEKIKERNRVKVKVVVKKNVIPHPSLEDKKDKEDVPKKSVDETPIKEVKNAPKDASYIEPYEIENLENNISEGVPKEEVLQLETDVFDAEVVYPQDEQTIFEEEVIPNVSLGNRIN